MRQIKKRTSQSQKRGICVNLAGKQRTKESRLIDMFENRMRLSRPLEYLRCKLLLEVRGGKINKKNETSSRFKISRFVDLVPENYDSDQNEH